MKKKKMFSMSQELASTTQTIASIITILAAFISAGAGVVTFIASSNLSRYSDESIAKANSVSAQANNSAAKANEKTEELNKQNLELQIRLEKERKERLELQRAVERRSLSGKDEKSIKDASSQIQSKLKIKVECQYHDTEARSYAEQIAGLLHSLGHSITPRGTGIVIQMGTSNTGVYALIYDTPQQYDALKLLAATGIATQVNKLSQIDPDGFHAAITVMAKPPYIT